MVNRISCTGLVKRYKEFRLGPIDFHLPAGYIMGIIGPNGAGKTTTLKLLLDMQRLDAGELSINSAGTITARQQARDQLGVCLDTTVFPDSWTCKQINDNMALFFTNWDTVEFFALLKQFDVNEKTRYRKLSKGTQTKVNLAVALSHHADLLILDEPASGLDPIARDELLDLLQSYIADGNASVLLSSHLTEDLEKITDYLLYIVDGQQVFFGETQALLEQYILIQGGLNEITNLIRTKGIGLRCTPVGFSAIIPRDLIAEIDKNLTQAPVNLEELMRYFGKRGTADA